MSAMTGTRSPTSPWPPEPSNLQLASSSTPAALLAMRDTHSSPLNPHITTHHPGSDLSPNYFSFSIDDANLTKSRDSISYPQPQIISPKSQFLPKKPKYENTPDAATSGARVDWSRASTASKAWCAGVGSAISVDHCAELLQSSPDDIMLFDVRPFTHYLKGSIKGSLNLCIPTTLLKRPSFDTQKLANTFTSDADKKNFTRWKNCRYIVAYDAHTSDMKDAGSLTNVLKKFIQEGWTGEGMILLGGFNAFSDRFPSLIKRQNQPMSDTTPMKSSPMGLSLPSAAPVAGGCALPESASVAIPFFSNIRQNMDLVSGVGQIPLQLPENLTEPKKLALPSWLRNVSDSADKGQIVSQKFLELEQKELERMKQALSYDKNASSNSIVSPDKFRVAGIEKGTKNRYNDIYPFDHSRVKLQDVAPGDCDYVNANYLKADYSEKRYIATQAPVPDTFNDFWRVIWEQDARLVVSLTAEVERGQVKCHPYWESGNYGPFKVNNFSQKKIYLNPADSQKTDTASRVNTDLNTDLRSLKPNELFGLLLKHASQQLYGAQFYADCTTFSFPGHAMDAKASSFAHRDDETVVLAARGQETLHVYHARDGRLQHRTLLQSPWAQQGVSEILKTGFDGENGLYVLQRSTPTFDEGDVDPEHPFVKDAIQTSATGQIFLVRHSLDSPNGPTRICSFPEHPEYRPLAFAAANKDVFVISWQHMRDDNCFEVIRYTVQAESPVDPASNSIELRYNSRVLVDESRQDLNEDRPPEAITNRGRVLHHSGPITDMAFNDGSSQLLFYYRARTLYGSFQRRDISTLQGQAITYDNSCIVQFSDSMRLQFCIDIPFFGTHESHSHNGLQRCQWKYLALGIATHREEGWTVACLLKSGASCASRNCGHVLNLDRGRRFADWTVVARLWGFRNPTNSLGSIVASSKRGTRLAVANWNILYVWALEPNALIDQNASGYYPPSWQSSASDMIELRPIMLPLDAVCFKLFFAQGENELVAITDKGLKYWDLSTSGHGRRVAQDLAVGEIN
ncbi:hypothetical protein P168DRAFT_300331 [Aspergillus campestris IBT 28561]|uniref:Uncharacterized protein n=1 Tax=Aspergillus campestris (strain IBT 28561) TaxID=1392248 RepID=A0A2I1CQK5_ASPC2|nr:uncharacterized protein P168DRAFT_300331 [Aspergillus campestris IBT 28561]PKX99904.1 hypothetical protein P168DRAFT_300331 [Aspergillus campestris IBT 28561]